MRRNQSISMFGLSPGPCSIAFVGAARPAFGPARAREGKRFAGCWPAAFAILASNVPSSSHGLKAVQSLAKFAHIGTFAASFLQFAADACSFRRAGADGTNALEEPGSDSGAVAGRGTAK